MATLSEIKEALKAGHISEDEAVDLVMALDKPTTGQGTKLAGADNMTVPEKKSLLDPRNWSPKIAMDVPAENEKSALNPRNWNWRGTAAPAASMLAMAGSGGLSVPTQIMASAGASSLADLGESAYRKYAKSENISLAGAGESALAQGGIDAAFNALPIIGPLKQGLKSALPFEKTGANMLINQMQNPVAKTAARQALEEAEQKGMPVPPSVFLEKKKTAGKIARWLEGLSDLTVSGSMQNQSQRKKFFDAVNQEAETIAAKSTKDPGRMGEEVAQWVNNQANKDIPDSLRVKASEGWNVIFEPFGGQKEALINPAASVPMNNFQKTLADIVAKSKAEGATTPALEALEKAWLGKGNESKNLVSVVDAFKDIYKKKLPNKYMNQQLREAIEKDVSAFSPEVGEAWKVARENSQAYLVGHLKNPLVKKVMQGSKNGMLNYEAVISTMFAPGQQKNLKSILDTMPKSMAEDMKARYLANYFDERSPIGKKIVRTVQDSSERFIDGKALRKALRDNKEVLDAFMDQDSMRALNNLADYADLGSSSVGKYLKLANQDNSLTLATKGAAATGLGVASLWAPLATEGGGLIMAHSLMSPGGKLKKLLVGGKEIPSGALRNKLTVGNQIVKMGESVRERSNKAGKERGR